MAAVPLAVRSPRLPRMKCCCQVGRTTHISNSSSHAINRESNRRTAPCYLWVAATISCLLNPQARKSFSVFAVPGLGSSGISTRASGMIQLSTGPCETNWTGSLPDSPENRHQAIVHRRNDSHDGIASDSKVLIAVTAEGRSFLVNPPLYKSPSTAAQLELCCHRFLS